MISITIPATILRSDIAHTKLADIEQRASVRRIGAPTGHANPQGWTSAVIDVAVPVLRYVLDALKEILIKSDALGKGVEGQYGKQSIDFKCGDMSLSVKGADFKDMDQLLARVTALCGEPAKGGGKTGSGM